MYTPDRWFLIELDSCYKVFGSWSGGYLDGDSWQMNSGIVNVEEEGDYYLFHGYSGSVYKCHKNSYGAHAYGYDVFHMYKKRAEEVGAKFIALPEDVDPMELNYARS